MNARPLILIADDHADAREMYGRYLESEGFRWTDAVSGRDAVIQARIEVPAVILLDLTMPRLDGWEAMRELRADAATSRIPCIIVTGDDSPDLRDRARDAGAVAFLVKPVPPEDLIAEIRTALDRRDAGA